MRTPWIISAMLLVGLVPGLAMAAAACPAKVECPEATVDAPFAAAVTMVGARDAATGLLNIVALTTSPGLLCVNSIDRAESYVPVAASLDTGKERASSFHLAVKCKHDPPPGGGGGSPPAEPSCRGSDVSAWGQDNDGTGGAFSGSASCGNDDGLSSTATCGLTVSPYTSAACASASGGVVPNVRWYSCSISASDLERAGASCNWY